MPIKFKNTSATNLADPSQKLLKGIFSPSKVEIVRAEKKLTFSDRVVELFYIIDDEVLSTRNKRLIKDVHEEKKRLKLNLIKLFNCNEELIDNTIKEIKKVETESGLGKDEINQPSSSSQANAEQNFQPPMNSEEAPTGSFNDYLQAIKVSIQFFKGKNIDLSFLAFEINMILAYLLKNSLTSEEKVQLNELTLANRIPGRELDLENIPDYIYFYEQDPIKTCIVLLKDYSKGEGCLGIIYRFFSGAWKRNYKDPVNKFLSIYKQNELPDNITICGIYEKLKDLGLLFNFDAESKSSLRKILLFCAKLNNEEESLLHLIVNCSLTSFPPLDRDRQFDCCFGT
ncbi:hypothetical protein [Rickettsiella endosymbiont of Rhagonycha lignosa]|uniref:hypothetical protein n=1 Tax=Rickettsiella endosymbiont of Rhagonycha lignosa TaxID=3077937 RepID=UPI00313E5863